MRQLSWTLQQKGLLSLQFGQEENTPGRSFERIAYLFVLKAARVFHISTGRVEGGWWTLSYWLTLLPHVSDSLEGKSLLAPSKKGLPSPFSLAGKRIYLDTQFERRGYWFALKAMRVFSIFTGRIERGYGEHFANS